VRGWPSQTRERALPPDDDEIEDRHQQPETSTVLLARKLHATICRRKGGGYEVSIRPAEADQAGGRLPVKLAIGQVQTARVFPACQAMTASTANYRQLHRQPAPAGRPRLADDLLRSRRLSPADGGREARQEHAVEVFGLLVPILYSSSSGGRARSRSGTPSPSRRRTSLSLDSLEDPAERVEPGVARDLGMVPRKVLGFQPSMRNTPSPSSSWPAGRSL